MKEAENILLDFNGTLVDDLDLCLNLLNIMLKMCHHSTVTKEEYLEIFGFPVIEYYKRAGFTFPKDDFDALAEFFIQEYEKHNLSCPLNEGVLEMLEYYKKKGKHLYIISASDKDVLMRQLRYYKIDTMFDGISALDNAHASGKIDTAKIFIRQRNIDPNQSIFIGDTLHDKEVADALKMDCILIAKGHQSKARLESGDTIVIDSMKDLIHYIQ